MYGHVDDDPKAPVSKSIANTTHVPPFLIPDVLPTLSVRRVVCLLLQVHSIMGKADKRKEKKKVMSRMWMALTGRKEEVPVDPPRKVSGAL